MLKTSVKNSDKVRNALQKKLAELNTRKSVLIGIRGDAGMSSDGGITLATQGAINEFGTPNIPERSFLRTGIEDARPDIIGIATNRLAKDGVDKTLGLIGITAQNAVQNKIVSLRSPANAQSTVAAKGSSNPLVDTGLMLGAITYVISEENIEEGL